MKKPKIIDDYLNYLICIKCYSEETVKSYGFDLQLFVNFIKKYKGFKEINKFSLLQIGEDDIYAFLVYCNYYRDNNPYTRQRKIVSIRGLYDWILDSFKNDDIINPTSNIKALKKIVRLPKYLNLEQAKKIQNVFNEKNSHDPVRNNLIITFFLSSGVRTSELINIQIEDINFNQNQVKIYGKGGKERTAYFSNYAKEKILNYIKERKSRIFISREKWEIK